MKLPLGYRKIENKELTSATHHHACGIYSRGDNNPEAGNPADPLNESPQSQAYAKANFAQHLNPWVQMCHVNEVSVKNAFGEEWPQVEIKIIMKPDFPQLKGTGGEGEHPRYWTFAMQVRNPIMNPQNGDNWFVLKYAQDEKDMRGETLMQGWPILGVWDCKYSEWSGRESCPAECGGGTVRLTRKLLNQPPPKPHRGEYEQTCPGPYEKFEQCNTFPCKFPCELVEAGTPGSSQCTAECGGGLRFTRWRWRGEGCPQEDDHTAVQAEICNPQPCKVRCKLADTWTVVTGCSEVCGQGTYRMMREVLQKDENDEACQPDWREVKCVRQWCTQLSIIRPDRNILPYPADTYYVGLAFKLTFPVEKITINAPGGYSFGQPGSSCEIHDHDMFPWFKECKVGVNIGQGKWEQSRSITLSFKGLLDPNQNGRYSFQIAVVNPPCELQHYSQVVSVGEEPGLPEVCKVPWDQNVWEMQLTKDRSLVAEGHQRGMSIFAPGYELHNPQDTKKMSGFGGKDLLWGTSNAGSNLVSAPGRGRNDWRSKVIFCSPRLEPCPNDAPCPRTGVCPMTDFDHFDGDDNAVVNNQWSLPPQTDADIIDENSALESDELETADETAS